MVTLRLFEREAGTPYSAGQFIFRQGDTGDSMYVVQEGELEILVNDTVVETVMPGGIVGELALIDEKVRSASVRTRTNSKVVPIDSRRFEFLVRNTPFFATQIMKLLAERLRNSNQVIRPKP